MENNGKIETQIPITDKDSQEIIIDVVMEGKSAYDLAVERGYEGTVDDWLNSLVKQSEFTQHKLDYEDLEEEISTARGTELTLGARLDSTDAQLNNMTQDFTQHKLDYASLKNVTDKAKDGIASRSFKVADKSIFNSIATINEGIATPTGLNKTAANNGGIDGVVVEYASNNDGVYPLSFDQVPFRLIQTYRRPTADQYSQSTFEFEFNAPKEVENRIYYSFLVKKDSVNNMTSQALLGVRSYQISTTGTSIVDLDLRFKKSELLVQGSEKIKVSNGIEGRAVVLQVTDEWILVGFTQSSLYNSSIATLRFRIGLSGLAIPTTDRTIEYYNFVLSNKTSTYINAFEHSPKNNRDLYGDRLIDLIEEKISENEIKINELENLAKQDLNFLNNDRYSQMVTFSNFDKNEWVGATDNNIRVINGLKSAEISSINSSYAELDWTGSPINMSELNFWLRCYIEDASTLHEIEVRFCVDGDWNKRFSHFFSLSSGSKQYLQNGWNDLTATLANMRQFGVTKEDLKRISMVRIRVRSKPDTQTTVVFDTLAFIKNPISEGLVSIAFDDGMRSLETEALPYMSQYGMRGVAYIVPAWVGRTDKNIFATKEQLLKLERAGWDISSHTYNHSNLTTISLEEAEEELKTSKEWLLTNGFKRGAEHIAYPQGDSTPEIRDIVKKYYKSGRISSGGAIFPGGRLNSFPLVNNYQIQVIGVYMSTLLSSVYEAIDRAKNNKVWCVLMFHGLYPDENVNMNLSDFKLIIDYINNSGVKVVTFSDITN